MTDKISGKFAKLEITQADTGTSRRGEFANTRVVMHVDIDRDIDPLLIFHAVKDLLTGEIR